MESIDRKTHWENIYQTKPLEAVSWYQAEPSTSLGFFEEFNVPLDAKIIDVGGGDSLLVDYLLDRGYTHLTVLDISAAALARAQARLGARAQAVRWIEADAASFVPDTQYDFWHDRAAFHFLTSDEDIARYIDTVQGHLRPGGVLVVGTFSEEGPRKCSGIEVKQYSEASMTALLDRYFEKLRCIRVDHATPFETVQNFVFCSFRRMD